jgi:hypothetical protein
VSLLPHLTRVGRTYVVVVVLLGFAVIAESLLRLYSAPIGAQWLLLAFLTLISGSACVELPHSNVTISISEAFVFAAVLLYGPAAGTLTVALDGLVISFWIAKRRPETERALLLCSIFQHRPCRRGVHRNCSSRSPGLHHSPQAPHHSTRSSRPSDSSRSHTLV